MAPVDGVVRALIEKRVGEPVLALARFKRSDPDWPVTPSFAGWAEQLVVWLWWSPHLVRWFGRRRAVALPRPAYLAVCETTVTVFSARFGHGTRLLGPFEVWQRSDITEVRVEGNGFRLSFRPAANRELVDIEAVQPGPEATSVIRYLSGSTSYDALT